MRKMIEIVNVYADVNTMILDVNYKMFNTFCEKRNIKHINFDMDMINDCLDNEYTLSFQSDLDEIENPIDTIFENLVKDLENLPTLKKNKITIDIYCNEMDLCDNSINVDFSFSNGKNKIIFNFTDKSID